MSSVKLLGHFPSKDIEEFIVSTARLSTDSSSKETRGLLRYLFRHEHLSPFEFANFTFEIECPIFVKNQIVRHRSAKFNERSLRYVQYKEDFYRPSRTPAGIRFRDQSSRQSSIQDDYLIDTVLDDFIRIESKLEDLFSEYQNLISKKVAYEVARFCLPMATLTKFRISFDLRNLLHFLRLRTDKAAQLETRLLANDILELIRPLVPQIIEVWEDYDVKGVRIATLDYGRVSEAENRENETKKRSLSSGPTFIDEL